MRYTISRDVEEWIEVEADSEEAANVAANETPIEQWDREVHDERTTALEDFLRDRGVA